MAEQKFLDINNLKIVWSKIKELYVRSKKLEKNYSKNITTDIYPTNNHTEVYGVYGGNEPADLSNATEILLKNDLYLESYIKNTDNSPWAKAVKEVALKDSNNDLHIIKSINNKTITSSEDMDGISVDQNISLNAGDIYLSENAEGQYDSSFTIQEVLDSIQNDLENYTMCVNDKCAINHNVTLNAGDIYLSENAEGQYDSSFTIQKAIDSMQNDYKSYFEISTVNEFNAVKNGDVVNLTQEIKIGDEVFVKGTYVKSNNTLVSINAPKVVDVDMTEYMRLNDLENSRNYAKGTGYALKFDQNELGSSSNAKPNDGNCYIYPISGLKQGELVTVSFDWYYKDERGIASAFNKSDADFVISMGVEYDYGGGPFVGKNNYEQYKISDTEIKGHCSMNVTIKLGDVNTVSYPYIQNHWVGVNGSNHYLEISNFMVVKGEKELPWKPAPEDSYDFPYNIPWANNSRMKIMPGLYNVLGKDSTISNISCGFRQLANTNKLISKYTFEWTAGSNGTTLILPADIKWLNNETPTFEAYQKYKVIVENNFAKCEKGGYQYYKDFSFVNGKFYEVNYEGDSWLYWQTDNGEGIYTENFGLNKNNDTFQYRVYVDSSLSEEYLPGGDDMGFTFEYSSTGDHTLASNDGIPKIYHLLKPNTGLYKKDNNGYVSMIFTTD